MFDLDRCTIPTVYCGTKKSVPKKTKNNTRYVRKGTNYECMTKGFGAGMAMEKLKKLPLNSLQRIKYVGETYELNFKKKNVNNIDQLINHIRNLKKEKVSTFLKSVFRKKDGVIDQRAYNSTLVFLYENGVHANLPQCSKIKEI